MKSMTNFIIVFILILSMPITASSLPSLLFDAPMPVQRLTQSPFSQLPLPHVNTKKTMNPDYEKFHDPLITNALRSWANESLPVVPKNQVHGYLIQVDSQATMSILKHYFETRNIHINHEYKQLPLLSIENITQNELEEVQALYPTVSIIPDYPVYAYESSNFNYMRALEEQVNPDGSLDGTLLLSTARDWLGFTPIQEQYHLYGDGLTVGIIDSGVNYTLPAFQTKMNGERRNITSKVVPELINEGVWDKKGHGTHVASVLVGNGDYLNTAIVGRTEMVYNDSNVRGFLPNADLVSVKVLDKNGEGLVSWVLEGFEIMTSYDIDVLNLSFGSPVYNGTGDAVEVLARQLWDNNVIIVAAAGNSGPWGSSIGNPAVIPFVLSVGAFETYRKFWALSSWGPDQGDYRISNAPLVSGGSPAPDIVAPGVNVIGLNARTGGLEQLTGTSLATPMITGIAGALKQAFPNMTNYEINAAILKSAFDLGELVERQGVGMINATKAFLYLQTKAMNNEPIITVNPPRLTPQNMLYKVQIINSSKYLLIAVYSSMDNVQVKVDYNVPGLLMSLVNHPTNQLTLLKGYTLIPFNFTITETTLKYLSGNITFVAQAPGNDTAIISFASYTRFPEARILFDASKDADTPSGYYHGDRGDAKYSYLSSLLEDEGFYSSTTTADHLRPETLNGYDVLIISDPDKPYRDDEVQTIHDFVQNGGSLIVFGWGEDTLLETYYAGNASIPSLNTILAPYGMQLESTNSTSDMIFGETTNLMPGLKVLHWGPRVTITNGNAFPIIHNYLGGLKYIGYKPTEIFAASSLQESGGTVTVFGSSVLMNNYNLRTGYGLVNPIDMVTYSLSLFHEIIKNRQVHVNYELSQKQVYFNQPFSMKITVTFPNGTYVPNLPLTKTLYLIGPYDTDKAPFLFTAPVTLVSKGIYYTPELSLPFYGKYNVYLAVNVNGFIPTDGEFTFKATLPYYDELPLINLLGFMVFISFMITWLLWFIGERQRIKSMEKPVEIKIHEM